MLIYISSPFLLRHTILLCLALLLCSLAVPPALGEELDYIKKTGKCKGLWRPDSLPGRCFGLKQLAEFKELKELKVEKMTKDVCRTLCCNMGTDCVTFQFLGLLNSTDGTGTCTLGS